MIDRVVVINDDSTESGGAAVIALTSVKVLREQGVKVTMITGDAGNNTELSDSGAEIVALGGRHLLEGGRAAAAVRGLYNRKALHFLDDWIQTRDTPGTIYHLHNWHKVLSPSVFSCLRKVSSRLIISAHDYFLVCPNGGYYNFVDNQLCNLVPMSRACIFTSCDKRNYGHKIWRVTRQSVRSFLFDLSNTPATVLAVHSGMVPHLERGGVRSDSIRVIRNPVVPWSRSRVAAETNKDVFFVGRLEHDKGIEVLAQAARKAGVTLKVIGDGPLKTHLQTTYPEVGFLGRRTKGEISKLITSARILVLPTLVRETFGLVALEGLMSGIPVIVSNSAPIAEDIVALNLGRSCPVADVPMLAEQILELMDDDELIADMSRRAFVGSSQLAPSPAEWCCALLALYENKIAGTRGNPSSCVRWGAVQEGKFD